MRYTYMRNMQNQAKPKAPRKVARLRSGLKRAGVTNLQIAQVTGASEAHVCNVLAGRDKSRRVVDAAQMLLDRAASGNGAPQVGRDSSPEEAPTRV